MTSWLWLRRLQLYLDLSSKSSLSSIIIQLLNSSKISTFSILIMKIRSTLINLSWFLNVTVFIETSLFSSIISRIWKRFSSFSKSKIWCLFVSKAMFYVNTKLSSTRWKRSISTKRLSNIDVLIWLNASRKKFSLLLRSYKQKNTSTSMFVVIERHDFTCKIFCVMLKRLNTFQNIINSSRFEMIWSLIFVLKSQNRNFTLSCFFFQTIEHKEKHMINVNRQT